MRQRTKTNGQSVARFFFQQTEIAITELLSLYGLSPPLVLFESENTSFFCIEYSQLLSLRSNQVLRSPQNRPSHLQSPRRFLKIGFPPFSYFGHDGLKPCPTYAINVKPFRRRNQPAPRTQDSPTQAALRPSSAPALPSPQHRDRPPTPRLSPNDTPLSSLIRRAARLPCPFLSPAHARSIQPRVSHACRRQMVGAYQSGVGGRRD